LNASLALSQINADILTEGKQRVFNETLQKVQAGLIRTTPY